MNASLRSFLNFIANAPSLLTLFGVLPIESTFIAGSYLTETKKSISYRVTTIMQSNFEKVLESVEALSVDEQGVLIDLVQRRLVERRRAEITAHIAQAQVEYQAGKVFRGTVDQVVAELRERET